MKTTPGNVVEMRGIKLQFGDKVVLESVDVSLRARIGMVYQYAALISSLDVHDNIGLPLRELTDKNRKEIDAVIDQKLELVGLMDVLDKLPSELSGGMQKRVGLARALALDPELVLFDEPSARIWSASPAGNPISPRRSKTPRCSSKR